MVGEETNLASLTQSSIQRQVQDRDSRSTVGTRSSVDFSTNGSAVAASTAPSTSGPTGNEHSRSQSYNSQHSPSVQRKDELGHSASSSVSGGGAGEETKIALNRIDLLLPLHLKLLEQSESVEEDTLGLRLQRIWTIQSTDWFTIRCLLISV